MPFITSGARYVDSGAYSEAAIEALPALSIDRPARFKFGPLALGNPFSGSFAIAMPRDLLPFSLQAPSTPC